MEYGNVNNSHVRGEISGTLDQYIWKCPHWRIHIAADIDHRGTKCLINIDLQRRL